jgi:AraC family transcriptional regulator
MRQYQFGIVSSFRCYFNKQLMIQPRIEVSKEKKLIGKCLKMSLVNNKTFDLWRSFMPERMKIQNKLSNDLISMRVYKESLQLENINQEFEKWAALEVSDFDNVPDEMERFVLPAGTYAVFDYKGLSTDNSIFVYIFKEWLPGSNYVLDERPHFEMLGEKYKNNDLESEEEIWIPVKLKK